MCKDAYMSEYIVERKRDEWKNLYTVREKSG